MRKFFVQIYRFFEHHRILMWSFLSLLVLLFVFGLSRLDFVEDISCFFPKNGDNQRINYAYQHIGSDNRIVLNVKLSQPKDSLSEEEAALLMAASDSLGAQLARNDADKLMKGVMYQVDQQQVADIAKFVVNNMPYFLEEEDYARIDSMLSSENIENQLIDDQFFYNSMTGDVILSDPLFFSAPVLKKLEGFRLGDQYHEKDGYIFNKSENEAIVVVTSKFPVSETQNNVKLISQVEKSAEAVEKAFGGKVEVSVFGASLISQTNAQQIKKDSLYAMLLALVLIVALLVYYYRNFKSILLIICTITFGGLLAMGVIVWFKNPISIIAVGVASIIIGLAINYPIHLLSHFKKTEDKEQIISEIVTPLLIGNITTVGAFLSLLFISSDAMRDLGLFAALLLVGTIVFVLIFLPHLLGKRPQNWQFGELSFRKVAEFHPEKHPWQIALVLLLTVVFLIFSFKTSFETDMHKINYMTAEQRAQFEKLVAEADTTVQTVYCIAEGETSEEALRNNEKVMPQLSEMQQNGSIEKVSGISVFLPSREMQQQRIARWNAFWQPRRDTFLLNFKQAEAATGWQPFNDFYDVINREYKPQNLDHFAAITQNIAASYIMFDDDKSLVYNVLSVDKHKRESVEKNLNSIDKNVFAFTDSSVIQRMIKALSGDFDYVLYICAFIVFAFLIFSFGRLEIALAAFVPLTIAWIWILGIMGVFDIKFNIVNIILATFIFGQGDDYAIFVTEGVMYEYRTGKKMLAQFKNSIILSATIMFIAIGTLIFAKHPAMRSLAEVTVIGMFSVVMMAYIFPPLIFKWLTTSGGARRRIPVTLLNWAKTVFAFTVFFLVSILLSIWSVFCIIFFKNNWKMKAHFHKFLSNLFRIFAKLMPQVACFVHNDSHYDFSKPAVLVANHQSHLDLLYTLMLSPKVVALTNKWVWNCPFYRWIIRYADCLPVDNGWEPNLPKLQDLVAHGYSILVFPEGTRAVDCTIGRFHQGAFALAEQLQVEVVPIVLHGVGHVFPKREFILNKGRVDVTILSPFVIDNQAVSAEQRMLSVTRSFRHRFIEEYKKICVEVETPAYFKELVKANYLYKGTEVARECRRQMRHFQQFEQRVAELPDSGSVVLRDCGQGEFALLAALVKKDLQITAVGSDAEMLEVARNCAACPANLRFVECS
ncbi:MAG: 1-acyl-sn-glycerol-3-phosphate acyltransferase [Bacteroidales bacterium]|nr:1-acyl-sn-glycerol-3-phosphate acyltransferase [Bacteroidales bacterium]